MITAARLRELLKDAPDNALVVVPGSDHSYAPATFELADAEIWRVGTRVKWMWEYYDEGNRSRPDTVVEKVVVLK